MKPTTAIQLLSERGWLSFTPPDFRKRVLERIRLRDFERGAAVYRAGDPPGGPWVILEGAAKIEMPLPGVAPHFIHMASSGFWFGEAPLIVGNRRLVTVITVRPSTLATLPLDDCHAILKADPNAWKWIALLSAMTTDLSLGVAVDSLLRDPTQRTAALLLRLAGVRSLMFSTKLPVPIFLSQERLGHLVNLSRNSMTPILRGFVRRGFVDVGYGTIRIADVAGLTACANGQARPTRAAAAAGER
jgi:CRP-like cAMP-binding protein